VTSHDDTNGEPRAAQRDGAPSSRDEVEVVLDLIAARYGRTFSEEELGRLREDVTAMLERTAALRAVPLTNADEPAPLFGVDAHGGGR
jgi:hypothetical protein